MRSKLMLALSVLLFVVLLTGCTQMNAEEIAKKMEEKYNAVKDFKGTLRMSIEGEGVKQVMEYEYVFKKPNKVRMYDKNNGVLMVSNGEKMWIYDEKKNEVMVMNVGRYSQTNPDYGEIVKDMLKRYDVKVLGSEKVSGRDCYVIQLTPKGNKSMEMKMWVDKEFWYPLKIERKMDGTKFTVEYLNVEFNTGVSDDTFQFTPPEGAKVITEENLGIKRFDSVEEAQKHVDFKILKPKYTAGYELKEVSLMGNFVTMTYTKNGKILMITEGMGDKLPDMPNAEKVKVGDSEGLYVKTYGSSMLVFKKNGVIVTITGTIDKDEIIKIAESME